jgi:hypothetical protein
MPSIYDTVILPTIKLTLSAKMDNHNSNGTDQQLNPQDILNHHAEKWQTPLTSEAFAQKLDKIDPLQHVRDEFYIPKVGGLPKGISI